MNGKLRVHSTSENLRGIFSEIKLSSVCAILCLTKVTNLKGILCCLKSCFIAVDTARTHRRNTRKAKTQWGMYGGEGWAGVGGGVGWNYPFYDTTSQ